jgi:hypothetical protein
MNSSTRAAVSISTYSEAFSRRKGAKKGARKIGRLHSLITNCV